MPQPAQAPPQATTAAERDDLRAMVRAFARDHFPPEEVRRVSGTDAGYDPAAWSGLGQLGLPGLLVPATTAARAAASPRPPSSWKSWAGCWPAFPTCPRPCWP